MFWSPNEPPWLQFHVLQCTAVLHCGIENQKVNANRFFLQQFLHLVQKCTQSYAKKTVLRLWVRSAQVYKTQQKQWFCSITSIWAMHAHGNDKPMKSKVSEPPKRSPDFPKSTPGRLWNVKKNTNGRKTPKTSKKCPQTWRRAENVPTWPQHAEVWARIWKGLAPLRKEMQYVKASMKCSGV